MIASPSADRAKPLVLVVDDDERQRLLFREVLEGLGFDVREVTDGAEAVAAVDRIEPDLAILDVVMPGIDGFQACAAIRSLPAGAHIPILMTTGLEDYVAVERAYQAGATDFINKPINKTLLGHRVRYLHRASLAVQELRVSQARLSKAEEIARLCSWELDVRSRSFGCSKGIERVFGSLHTQTATMPQLLARVHARDRDRVETLIEDAIHARRGFDIDFRIVRLDGAERIVAATAELSDDAGVLIGTFQDITERRQTEARIEHLAHHDALTNLPNRTLFRDRLEYALARAKREGSLVAVMCVDADRFKDVNDTLGHAAGDLLLQGISDRLQNLVRGSDTVARLGGDEFAVIQVGIESPDGCRTLAERILAALKAPFDLNGHEVLIGASVGCALFPMHGKGPEELLVKADVALYRAKAQGRGVCRVFEAGMEEVLRARKEMEQDLRRALAQGWFELHYQPQLTVDGGDVAGAEALLRLRHPTRGLLPPGDFISVAEETGLIVPIGAWTLRMACQQAARWNAEGPHLLRMAVNVSPVQLRQPDFIEVISAVLQEAGLMPDCLELEITEEVLMRDTAAALEVLGGLRQLGVRVVMDDFGTGYSSLSYLQLFPFDRIKIDRSFVQRICKGDDSAAIVRAILALGRSLNILTTAEGVEEAEQLAYLANEACDEVQGFFLGRAVPAECFAEQYLAGRADDAA